MSAVEYNVTNNDTVPIANTTNEDDLAAMTLSESTNNSSFLGNYSTTALSASTAPSTNAPSSSPTSSPSSLTPAPTYSALPIQPINIIVLTDVHSWVMGHGDHAMALGDIDYGHVLSFYQQFKETVLNHDLGADSLSSTSNTPDLYLVNNGDYLHGTLLGDDPGRYLSGILGKMPYDIVTVGDHELTNSDSLGVLREPGGLFDEWGDRLITSNVRITTDDSSSSSSNEKKKADALLTPLGRNYKLLHGNQGTVLVLGFLYDMGRHDQKSPVDLTVENVEDALKQRWFTSLFMETTFDSTGKEVHRPLEQFQFDVVLAMAHMDVEDELIALLHSTIRGYVGDTMTIQFVTGHTHKRAYAELDDYATSFEAGRYLETIGYVSFHPGVAGSSEHVFIDADRISLGQSLGMSASVEEEANEDESVDDDYPQWMTEDGMELSRYIRRTVEHAGADRILGCSNGRYRAGGRMDEADSLSRLYLERVLPASSYVRHASRSGGTHHHNSHNDKKKDEGQDQEHNVFVQYSEWSSGTTVSYDLFPGAVTVNDIYGVVPTDDTIVKLGHSIRGGAILDIVNQMNNNTTGDTIVGVVVESSSSNPQSSQEGLLPPIQNETMYTLHTLSRHAVAMQSAMIQLDVPAVVASSSSVKSQQSMRSLWLEFVQREWPYDGNDCQCLQDENGCGSSRSSSTDYIVAAPPAANGGGSGDSVGGSSSEFGEGETTATAAPTAHGGKSKHTSHNNPPSNHTHHGQSKGGHLGDFNKSRNPGASNMPVFWVTIATVAIIVFIVFRRPRGSQPTAVRRSEMPSDLELRESAAPGAYGAAAGGGGYGAPAVPRRGTYV
mmetsp:Transcript_18538/g.33161  ORF Transcript_18538/g.33161 Transcript_18538/m.33161 type:complete len:835 (+) Transcript_18538:135-2639(+)